MDFIKASDNDQIIVSISLTRAELKLITEGIGRTSRHGRIDAGMRPNEAQAVGEFYWVLEQACSCNGVVTGNE